MLETLKSSGVRPGRIKVEVHIEQNRVFWKGQNTDSSQSFSNGLGVKMRPSLRRPAFLG